MGPGYPPAGRSSLGSPTSCILDHGGALNDERWTDVTTMISSYVRDGWHTATDEGVPLRDASTGEPVARVSSTGVDLAGMVEHARTVGGPGLRELTFHQRAAALKRLAAPPRQPRAAAAR